MRRVLIVVHREHSFDRAPYFLRAIAEVWREEGVSVEVVAGPAPGVEADLAVSHVDVTVVPEDHLAFVRRYPVTINSHVADISKRRISDHIVQPGDGYNGPVIIKTDRNCGGTREARLARRTRPAVGWLYSLRDRMSWRWCSRLSTARYPVLSSPADVPRGVWRNPNLVVERFLPERRNDQYCLRTWVFLGDQETNSICYSSSPVIKSANVTHREPVAEVPEELRRMRQRLGFDFGKFDYAIVNDRVVLYDANRTPSVGHFPPEEARQRIRHLARGLDAYL